MSDEERAIVKEGDIPEGWHKRTERPAGRSSVAVARKAWTELMAEFATPIFGYKSYIGIDQRHGLTRTWSTSDAARYDGRELPGLMTRPTPAARLGGSRKSNSAGPRASRPRQRQRANAARSKVRSAVEHVFATQKHRMGLFIRTIGIDRAKAKIGLANIAFNFKRFTILGSPVEHGVMRTGGAMIALQRSSLESQKP